MEVPSGKKLPEQHMTGFRVADLLTIPAEYQGLISWMMRRGEFTLSEAVTGLKQDEEKLRTSLEDLVTQRLIKRIEKEGIVYYHLRLAHTSRRQMPKDIWKVLDQQTEAANVFISYSRRNKTFVKTLADILKKRGREVWVDWDSIPFGTDWWEEIKTGIEVADTFIFVLSPDSVASDVCAREIEHAVQHNKRLVPIVCKDVNPNEVHPELSKINWVFLRPEDDFDIGLRNLLNVLDTDLPYVRTHTRLLVRANEWNNSNRDESLLLRGSELEDARRWLSQSHTKHPQSLQLQKDFIWASYNAELGRQQKELEQQQRAAQLQQIWTTTLAIAGGLAIAFGIGSFVLYLQASGNRKVAEKSQFNAEIQRLTTLTEASEALFSSGQYFDALLQAVSAGVGFQQLKNSPPNLQTEVITALQQSIFGIQERNRLDGHQGAVWDVAFSSDGQWLASASADNTVRIWRQDGRLKTVLQVPGVQILSVAIAPDGKTLATAGDDSKIYLWGPDGVLLMTLRGHTQAIRRVSFSPDSKYLASASEDNTVRIWRRDGTLAQTLRGSRGPVNDVQFSPDGKQVAVASSDGTVRIWLLDGTPLRVLPHNDVAVFAVRFSADGRQVFSGASDGKLRVWSRGGQLIRSIAAHTTPIFSIAVSPDGTRMASAGWDKTIRIWKADGALLRTLPAHQSRIYRIEFDPDGETLVSAAGDRTVRLWQINPTLLTFLPSHTGAINTVRFSPDGSQLVTASDDKTLKIWRRDGALRKTLNVHRAGVTGVAFTPDGQYFVSVGRDRQMVLWTNSGEIVWTRNTAVPINAVAISPNGKYIATANQNNTVHLWSRDGVFLQALNGHTKGVLDVTFGPDSETLASASADNVAIVWNTLGQRLRTLRGHYGWVKTVRFSPDGSLIATGGADNTVILWNLDGTPMATLEGHQDEISALSFTPDSQLLATGSSDGTLRIWSRTGKPMTRLQGQGGRVYTLDFNPDGSRLVTAGSDDIAYIWDVKNMNNLDHLLKRGCDWMQNYLQSNQDLDVTEQSLCK
ncbi:MULTISPECIES: TIR domain-containing protein [unclassified Leptolyngbya]|uniref:WD40 domain-containing protein n=1 Tax=unclassified Leptolyngbya TaxID=2650499 RepID=UPI0016844A5D|nr:MULTISPECIES: TIR domain-containing protein [unclassified Leptolyngbya]MBD1912450.1 TIR domain-containing protein [Leptolyngbya sp. FACHB-8]MBD2157951.1 TIR domain-containing protein [Leptolyngbya sp. FACHB-16]